MPYGVVEKRKEKRRGMKNFEDGKREQNLKPKARCAEWPASKPLPVRSSSADMELAMLRRAVLQGTQQLSSIRRQLEDVEDEILAVEDFLQHEPAAELTSDVSAQLDALEAVGSDAFTSSFTSAPISGANLYDQLQQQQQNLHHRLAQRNLRGRSSTSSTGPSQEEKRALTLELLNQRLLATLGDNGDKESLPVCKALHGLQATRTRPKELHQRGEARALLTGEQRGDRHPYRLTIFSGEEATLSYTFNVDDETTFAMVLQRICECWAVDAKKFHLSANSATESGDFVPLRFLPSDSVISRLEELKYDVTRGFGCNGLTSSQFASKVYMLPPVYLMSRGRSLEDRHLEENNPNSERHVMSYDDARSVLTTGIREQSLRRLFLKIDAQHHFVAPGDDRQDCGVITFEGFLQVIKGYFEGNFFDRASLTLLFTEELQLVKVAENFRHREDNAGSFASAQQLRNIQQLEQERLFVQLPHSQASFSLQPLLKTEMVEQDDQTYEVIDFEACKRIVWHLGSAQRIQERRLAQGVLQSAENGRDDSNLFPHESTHFPESGDSRGHEPLSPARVYSWMLHIRVLIDQENNEATVTSRRYRGASVSGLGNLVDLPTRRLDMETFRAALHQAVAIDDDLIRRWWVQYFQRTNELVKAEAFATAWQGMRMRQAYDMPISIGEAVDRAVLAFEEELRQATIFRKGQKPSSSRVRTCVDIFICLISIGLIYAILFLEIQPRRLSRISRQYSRELLSADTYCYSTTEVGIIQDSVPTLFENIAQGGCIWGFVDGPLYDLYFLQASRAADIEEEQDDFSATQAQDDLYWKTLMYNRFVPEVVTIRQLVVNQSTCTVSANDIPPSSTFSAQGCFGSYSDAHRRTTDLQLNMSLLSNSTDPAPYIAASQWRELKFFDTFKGQFAAYDGSGYVFSLGGLDDSLLGENATLAERVDAAKVYWREAVQNLMNLQWFQTGARAIIINIGLINPNVNLYTNLQITFEVSDTALVHSSMSQLSFNVDVESTVTGNGFGAAFILRWVLLAVLVAAFSVEIYLTHQCNQAIAATKVRNENQVRTSQLRKNTENHLAPSSMSFRPLSEVTFNAPIIRNAENDSEARLDGNLAGNNDDDEGKEDSEEEKEERANTRRVSNSLNWMWTSKRFCSGVCRTVCQSSLLLLSLCIILWVAATVGISYTFIRNEIRKEFAQDLPLSAWNGVTMWQQYMRIAHFDALTLILLTCKSLILLNLFSRTAIVLQMLKEGFVHIVLFVGVLFLTVCVFAGFMMTSNLSVILNMKHYGTSFIVTMASACHFGLHEQLRQVGNPEVSALTYLFVLFFDMSIISLLSIATAILYHFYMSQVRKAEAAEIVLAPKRASLWSRFVQHCCKGCVRPESMMNTVFEAQPPRLRRGISSAAFTTSRRDSMASNSSPGFLPRASSNISGSQSMIHDETEPPHLQLARLLGHPATSSTSNSMQEVPSIELSSKEL